VGGFTQIWVERASNKVMEEGVPGSIRESLKPLLVGSEQEARLGGEAKL
jgi:hypothetical protein